MLMAIYQTLSMTIKQQRTKKLPGGQHSEVVEFSSTMDLQDNDLKLNILVTYSDGIKIKVFLFNVQLLNITIFKKKIKKKDKLTILISGVFDILCVDRSHYLMLILEINGNLRTPVRIELFNKGSLEIPRAHIL